MLAEIPLTVPFELHKNVIFVQASIANSAPLQFVLDSGTIRTTLDESVARKLGLDLSLKAQSSGVKGTQEVSVLKDQTLRLQGIEVSEPLMLSYPLDFLSKRIGHNVDGIIGVELFRKFVIELDYTAPQIRLWKPESFSYSGQGSTVPVTYHGRLPIVAGSVTPFGREAISTAFQLDTGGIAAQACFWKAFTAQHDLLAGAHDVTDIQLTMFGGTQSARQGRMQALSVGTIRMTEPVVQFSERGYGELNVFGANLGSGFFRQFKTIFDLPHDRVIFEPLSPR